jgi:cytochrome c oxidase subunit 3
MALAVRSAALGRNAAVIRNLVLTILIGCGFLGIKGVEYYLEYAERLVPRLNFSAEPPADDRKSAVLKGFDAFEHWVDQSVLKQSPPERQRSEKEEMFMLFYFIMTAFHATHMVVGIGVMLVMIWLTKRGHFSAAYHNPIEIAGLYWHFVDIVWIFLFPMLYLLRNP